MVDNQNSALPWFMRLTLVNTQTGRTTFAMYPQDQYSIFESLDCCQLPYGNGDYTHRAVSANGVPADGLLAALAGVIESENFAQLDRWRTAAHQPCSKGNVTRRNRNGKLGNYCF